MITVAGGLALLAAASDAQQIDGYVFTVKLSAGTDTVPVTAPMKIAGGQLRMEMADMTAISRHRRGTAAAPPSMASASPFMTGAYCLMQGEGKMTIVVPAMNMGMTMDAPAMLSEELSGIEIKDHQVAYDDLGTGGRVAGYETRKFRIRRKATASVATVDGTITHAVEQTSDVWLASDLGDVAGALATFQKAFLKPGIPGAAPTELAAKRPSGVSLRWITTTTRPDSTKQISGLEIVEIKKASFDAAEFTIPAGLQYMDGNAILRGRGRGGNQ